MALRAPDHARSADTLEEETPRPCATGRQRPGTHAERAGFLKTRPVSGLSGIPPCATGGGMQDPQQSLALEKGLTDRERPDGHSRKCGGSSQPFSTGKGDVRTAAKRSVLGEAKWQSSTERDSPSCLVEQRVCGRDRDAGDAEKFRNGLKRGAFQLPVQRSAQMVE